MSTYTLPDPECKFGFTMEQLEEISDKNSLGAELYKELEGATGAICDGDECKGEAHGIIWYVSDVECFFKNLKMWY